MGIGEEINASDCYIVHPRAHSLCLAKPWQPLLPAHNDPPSPLTKQEGSDRKGRDRSSASGGADWIDDKAANSNSRRSGDVAPT